MTTDALLLVGRTEADDVYDTHADRLRGRDVVDEVLTFTYERSPVQELRGVLGDVTADRAYVVPVRTAHTHETTDELPAALSYLDAETHYCEPVGGHPAIRRALLDRASAAVDPGPDAGLALAGFGNSGGSYCRRVLDAHAERLRQASAYGAVRTCYLCQNPAVECVRYSLPTDRAVVVPAFVAPCRATRAAIPDRLDLGRGGLAYADPLGTHPAVTDAIEAVVAVERTTGRAAPTPSSFENALTTRSPLATDGEG